MRLAGLFIITVWLVTGCTSVSAGVVENDTPLALRVTTTAPVPTVQGGVNPLEQKVLSSPTLIPSPTLLYDLGLTPTPSTPPLKTEPPFVASPAPFEPLSNQEEPPTPTISPTPLPRLSPEEWKSWPVVPVISQNAKFIYQTGQALGRDPQRFSKVGDCQNITTYFLAHFEDPDLYRLGEYASLQPAIDWFMGSFARESLAVKGGMNVATVLSPLRANPDYCNESESPLACEYRLYNPSFAIISMEEAWSSAPGKYGKYMRQVIEYTLEQGIVPVIATKADNLEGGDQINGIIAQLAWEYDIPLWNFWAAVQPLPNHGLAKDGFHLTHGDNFFFGVPQRQRTGYTLRNLTALQVIDVVWRELIYR